MKKAILVILSMIANIGIFATNITYWVNIDNAPNGGASGTMYVYTNGCQYPVDSAKIKFNENYGDRGGKYYSDKPLAAGSINYPIHIKCIAKKPWGGYGEWIYGVSDQVFTDPSMYYLPVLHIQSPTEPPINLPNPDNIGE